MTDLYEVWIDGKCIAVISDEDRKERRRLEGLAGVEIREASEEMIRKHRCRTLLPPPIVEKDFQSQQ